MTFSNVFGFDISKWQAAVDFAKMKQYGAKFLILRCAYGNTTDERFHEYMANSEPHYPDLSVYHYYEPYYTPTQQANKVISVLAAYKSRIRRVWLDLEFSWTGNYQAPEHWKTYRDIIKAAGYKIGWYTRKTWWDGRVGSYAAEFAKDPCWAAQYNVALTMIPKGWTSAMIWQSGTPSIGLAAGVSSLEIDYDKWNDDFIFADEWGGTQPPNGGSMEEYKVLALGLKIRTAPPVNGVLGPDAGKVMSKDDLIHVSAKQDGWLKIEKWIKPTGEVYPPSGVSWWCSGSYCEFIRVVGVPEPPPPVGETTVNLTLKSDGTVTGTWTEN